MKKPVTIITLVIILCFACFELVISSEEGKSSDYGVVNNSKQNSVFIKNNTSPSVSPTLVAATSELQEITLTLPTPQKVKIKMRLIPSGGCPMGSREYEVGRRKDEGPMQEIVISKPFYMGIYEVTQAQWAAVMGTTPSHFGYIADNPVECVSWEDCQNFIKKLNTMGIGTFRLPTEAEWEFAYRAHTNTRYPWGDDIGYNQIGQYAWYIANSNRKTHTVGQKKPNPWGLYDMCGNVFEWCSDWYGEYESKVLRDPKGPATGTYRVVRGGAYLSEPEWCRSAARSTSRPVNPDYFVGFRLIKIIE